MGETNTGSVWLTEKQYLPDTMNGLADVFRGTCKYNENNLNEDIIASWPNFYDEY